MKLNGTSITTKRTASNLFKTIISLLLLKIMIIYFNNFLSNFNQAKAERFSQNTKRNRKRSLEVSIIFRRNGQFLVNYQLLGSFQSTKTAAFAKLSSDLLDIVSF